MTIAGSAPVALMESVPRIAHLLHSLLTLPVSTTQIAKATAA